MMCARPAGNLRRTLNRLAGTDGGDEAGAGAAPRERSAVGARRHSGEHGVTMTANASKRAVGTVDGLREPLVVLLRKKLCERVDTLRTMPPGYPEGVQP